MSWWIFKCFRGGLCKYVHAVLCPGQANASSAPDVWVHENDLPPATKVIPVQTWCYTIDPSGARNYLPKGALTATATGTQYPDCTTCINAAAVGEGGGGDPNAHGGGGNSDGGGWGPGGGGVPHPPDPPPPVNPPAPCYIEATLCAGHTGGRRVFVPCNHLPTGTTIHTYGQRCYHVSSSGTQVTTLPPDAIIILVSGSFASCADCTDGVQAVPCTGQDGLPGWATRKDVWCPRIFLPTSTRTFPLDGICYTLDPAGAQTTMPAGAFIYPNPPNIYSGCGACLTGVPAVLCPDQINIAQAPALWVETDRLPATRKAFNQMGWCYTIDPATTPVRIPVGALIVTMVESWDDCATCKCGPMPDSACGYKAFRCAGNSTPASLDLWIKCADISASGYFYFRDDCWFVNIACTRSKIPKGAVTTMPQVMYPNCGACRGGTGTGDNGGGGFNAGGGGAVSIGKWPPPPGGTPGQSVYELVRCYTADGTAETWKPGIWVVAAGTNDSYSVTPAVSPGSVIKSPAGWCFKVLDPLTFRAAWMNMASGTWTAAASCAACSLIILQPCDGVGSDGWMLKSTWDATMGSPTTGAIQDGSGKCWKFRRMDATPTGAEITGSFTALASCADAACDAAPCNCTGYVSDTPPGPLLDQYQVSGHILATNWSNLGCTGTPTVLADCDFSATLPKISDCEWGVYDAQCGTDRYYPIFLNLATTPPCRWQVMLPVDPNFFPLAIKSSGQSPVGDYVGKSSNCDITESFNITVSNVVVS